MQLMTFALMGVFADNMIFSIGLGADRALKAAARPKQILPSAGLVALFSLIGLFGSVFAQRATARFGFLEHISMLPPLLFVALAYALLLLLANLASKPLFASLKGLLPGCAFNSIVMLLGTAGSAYDADVLRIIGFSIGTGVGFLLASLLIAEGVRRIGNPDMNQAFLGLPSVLIYIGILAMAFAGFTGGVAIPIA